MRAPSPLLTALLWVVAMGVLVQAALAGSFIGGLANLRLAHTILGWLLPFIAIAPAVVALSHRGVLSRGVVVGSAGLPVALWVQEMLGHMPGATATAVHVPLGVLLFGGSLALAITSNRPGGPPKEPSPPARSQSAATSGD